MLFANKQNLETELKVSLLSIRERELVLYSNNCRNIAECTAILSGFALVTLTYERQTTFSGFSPISKGAYELINYLAIILNSAAMFGATTCAMLGPGLALRGADGAMDQAVEGLALEFRTTFILFFFGIVSYFCCFTVFLSMDFINGDMYDLVLHLLLIVRAPHQTQPRVARPGTCTPPFAHSLSSLSRLQATFLFFLRSTFNACKRIYKKFRLPPEMTVSGAFDPDGRTRAHVTPEAAELDRLCERKRWWQWPRRQYLYFAVFMNEFVGISHAMFEERYMMNQVAPGTSRRPNNLVLHRILSYLEQPQARHRVVPSRIPHEW